MQEMRKKRLMPNESQIIIEEDEEDETKSRLSNPTKARFSQGFGALRHLGLSNTSVEHGEDSSEDHTSRERERSRLEELLLDKIEEEKIIESDEEQEEDSSSSSSLGHI